MVISQILMMTFGSDKMFSVSLVLSSITELLL